MAGEVKRIYGRWVVVRRGNCYLPVPREPLLCPLCGGVLLLHDFRCYELGTMEAPYCDVHMKCVDCGFFAYFGLAVEREDLAILRDGNPCHGVILKEEAEAIARELREEAARVVEDRLKRLGYW